jgi:hypothetical protein
LASKFRDIVDTPRFREELGRIKEIVQRVDEALEGVNFKLQRKPESGFNLGRVWGTAADLWDGQSIAVYYTFDETTVTRQSVRLERIVG